MQVKITTSIDSYLKASFESTQDLHGRTFSELLEEGIRQILADVNPLEYLKIEIAQKELELSELRSRFAEVEVLEAQKKKIVKRPMDDNEQLYAKKREELFVDKPGSLVRIMKKNGSPNWNNLYLKYGFESAKEMEMYVRKEVLNRGLL